MADVFISYSRKDGEFVKRLHGALDAQGRDVWVDWEDIPPSWDWQKELSSGIDSAAALVFVISPDSIGSEVCARELDQALARGKRVIPIVVREPDGLVVPPPLADRNWIFFRGDEEFEQGVTSLVAALDTDAEWVREHTRLLVRAAEWDAEDRDASTLLRGTDLNDAEAALASWHAGTEPAPTQLQHEYVAASRHAAVRRTRLLLGSVAIALAISVVLGIFALIERNKAIDREREAKSRSLAVEALLRADSDPELSVLLGIEAARLGRTQEAEEALRRAVSGLQSRGSLRIGRKPVGTVSARSRDLILVAGGDGTLKVWDAVANKNEDTGIEGESLVAAQLSGDGKRALVGQTGKAFILDLGTEESVDLESEGLVGAGWTLGGRVAYGLEEEGRMARWDTRTGKRLGPTLGGDGGDVYWVAANDNGRRVLATYADGRVRAWDGIEQPRELPTYRLGRSTNPDASISPDGTWALGMDGDDTPLVWDVATGRKTFDLRGHTLPVISSDISFDGKLIATGAHDNKARIWSAESGRPLRVLRGHGDSITQIDFSRDGRRVVTVSSDETVRVWSIATGETLTVLRGQRGDIAAAELTSDGRYVVTGGNDGVARIYEASSGRALAALPHDTAIESAALDPAGKLVASSGPDRLQFGDADTGELPSHYEASALTHGSTSDMDFDPRGDWLAVADGSLTAAFDLDKEDYTWFEHDSGVSSVDWSRDGRRIVAAVRDGTVAIFQPGDMTAPLKEMEPGGDLLGARFTPDARRIVALDYAGKVSVLDAASGSVVDTLGTGSDAAALELSPDGRTAAIAGSDGNARLWRIGSSGKPRALEHKAYVTAVRFSRDGKLVATASGDGTARVWDARTGRVVHVFRRHTEPVQDVDFSPDGRYLISAGSDRQVILWDLTSGRAVSVFGGYDGRVMKARFSRDGRKVLTVPEEGAVAVLSCDACGPLDDVIERARRLVGRKLTDAERERFLD